MKPIKTIALILAFMLLLCSCSGGKTETVTGGSYMLATGKAGGTYYSFGTCLASVWDKYTQSSTNIATTSGSVQNIEMLLKENADFAFVQNDILYYALEGKEMYEENPQKAIELYRAAAEKARDLGIGLNAGHDLNLKNLNAFVKAFPWLAEVSIGHALIADALYMGIEKTIKQYKYALSSSN